MASDAASSLRVWPVGGGHAGALIQARDWCPTPLGEIGQWPERLRAAVDNCLAAAFASFVGWGPELIQFYNDPALAVVRARHPDPFGVPAREACSDVWTAMGPAVEPVMGTGTPVAGERVPLASGQPRELARLRFSCSALRGGAGAVAGILVSTFAAAERARAEPTPCGRTSFEVMDQGYLLVDVIFDEAGRAVDIEYVEANPAARNAPWLVFNWVEENGRRAVVPPVPKGYGRELIEQAPSCSHGAETRYQLDETGSRCSIALPLGTDTRQERRS
jgi:hypothetical protein